MSNNPANTGFLPFNEIIDSTHTLREITRNQGYSAKIQCKFTCVFSSLKHFEHVPCYQVHQSYLMQGTRRHTFHMNGRVITSCFHSQGTA